MDLKESPTAFGHMVGSESEHAQATVYGFDLSIASEAARISKDELMDGLMAMTLWPEKERIKQAFVLAMVFTEKEFLGDGACRNKSLILYLEGYLRPLHLLGVRRICICLPSTETGRELEVILGSLCGPGDLYPFDAIQCLFREKGQMSVSCFDLASLLQAKGFFHQADSTEYGHALWLIIGDISLSLGTIEKMRESADQYSNAIHSRNIAEIIASHVYVVYFPYLFACIERMQRTFGPKIPLDHLFDGTLKGDINGQQNGCWSLESLTEGLYLEQKERFLAFQVTPNYIKMDDGLACTHNSPLRNLNKLTREIVSTPLVIEKEIDDEPIDITAMSEADLHHLIYSMEYPKKYEDNMQAFLVKVEKLEQLGRNNPDESFVVVFPEHTIACANACNNGQAVIRRTSALASDVTQICFEADVSPNPTNRIVSRGKVSQGVHGVQMVVKKRVPAIGYAILAVALVAASSQGAVLGLLPKVPPLVKLFWRMFGASLAFLPLAIYFYQQSLQFEKKSVILVSIWQRKNLFLTCAVAYLAQNSAFLTALNMTRVDHVYIFGNCHSLLVLAGRMIFLNQKPQGLQVIGALLGFSGIITLTMENQQPRSQLHDHTSLWGDGVAFLGAFAAVIYLFYASRARQVLQINVFLFLLSTCVWIILLPILMILSYCTFSYQGLTLWDANVGLFGWIHHLPIELYIVAFGSFAGSMGFIVSMKYFDPLVISVTMLLEPMVATVIGVAMGMSSMPGIFTVVGGSGAIAGCALTIYASHASVVKVNISNAIQLSTGLPRHVQKSIAQVAETAALQRPQLAMIDRRQSFHLGTKNNLDRKVTTSWVSSLFGSRNDIIQSIDHANYGSFP